MASCNVETATSYHNESDCHVLCTANDSHYLNNYTTTITLHNYLKI